IKSSISTADSKALCKKACVYLSSLMYAKNSEEFDGVQFHTNNLKLNRGINQLKTHYLKRTRKHRIDYIVWVLTQVVDCAYRQSILQVFHGFDVSLTKEEKKRHKTAYELDDNTAAEYISIVDAQKVIGGIENFVHNQPFKYALVNTTTAITNMWSRKRLTHGLRVLIHILLRVWLRLEKFSRYIEYRNLKKKAKNDGNNDYAKNDRNWYFKNKFICDELAEKLHPTDNTPTTVSVSNTDQGDDPEDIEDLDFDHDNDEDEQEHTNLFKKTKKSTSKTVRSLVAVVSTLVQSSDTGCEVETSDIKKLVYSSSTITEHELAAAADVINLLRPYVPKSSKGSECNRFTLPPLAFITNTVLRAVGLPKEA
ncbi:hypothetical protein INT45_008777, partial [Circinella minor]